jgi:hypothetical protein
MVMVSATGDGSFKHKLPGAPLVTPPLGCGDPLKPPQPTCEKRLDVRKRSAVAKRIARTFPRKMLGIRNALIIAKKM